MFSWGGNPGVGSLHRLRDAVEHGWPRPLELEEHSHAAMAQRLCGGRRGHAVRLPSRLSRHATFRASIPHIRFVTCPFTGEELACVPALRPDVTIIHAQKADRDGNVLIEGIVGVQKEAVLAARRSIVTVEEVVRVRPRRPTRVILPAWTRHADRRRAGGARPSYAHGYYSRDNAFYVEWDAIASERDTFRAWMQDDHVGGRA